MVSCAQRPSRGGVMTQQPTARQIIECQVGRARRRLVTQLLLRYVAAAWAASLLLTATWMLAEPFAVAAPADWLRWAVLGSTAGVLTFVAIIWTVRKAPS